MKCLYCKKDIPKIKKDSLGKKLTKKIKFCRDTNCYRKWWDNQNKEYMQIRDRIRYLKIMIAKGEGEAYQEELAAKLKIFEKLKKERRKDR